MIAHDPLDTEAEQEAPRARAQDSMADEKLGPLQRGTPRSQKRDVGLLHLSGLRKTGVAYRYGGEELVVVLHNCDHEHAMARAEMIRARVEQLSEAYNFRIIAWLGVGTSGQHGRTIAALMSSADAALYAAELNGRNRVMSANTARSVSNGLANDFAIAAE